MARQPPITMRPSFPRSATVIPPHGSVIPAQAGIHRTVTAEHTTPPHGSVIPAQAGIHRTVTAGHTTPLMVPSFPRIQAGIHRTVTAAEHTTPLMVPSFPRRRESTAPSPPNTPLPSWFRHSREGGNPPHRHRRTHHSPHGSVIPAKAGIHRTVTAGHTTSRMVPSFPRRRESTAPSPPNTPLPSWFRHSREGGNPPHRHRRTHHSPHGSVIPAKAGIHRTVTAEHTTPLMVPSFPRRRESTAP